MNVKRAQVDTPPNIWNPVYSRERSSPSRMPTTHPTTGRYMHAHGVVHGDMSLGLNIMLKRDNGGLTAAFFDFGDGATCNVSEDIPLPVQARAVDTYAFGDILAMACYGCIGALERAGRGYGTQTCHGFEKIWQ